jgi:catechol 2,3-dioxygenase-like lactoylglutathione lyase family enzyme
LTCRGAKNSVEGTVQPLRVLESCVYATDLDAAERFYTQVIGLAKHAREDGRHVFFRCADGMVLVFNPSHTDTVNTMVCGSSLPLHGTRGAGHLAFAVREEDISGWRSHLKQAGVEIESEVHWPQGGTSLYIRDPAGNSIELASPQIWGLPQT